MGEYNAWQPDFLVSRWSFVLSIDANSYKASSKDEILSLGRATIRSLDVPFPLAYIELGSDHDGVKSAVFLDPNDLVNMIKIVPQVLVVGVIVGPVPCIIYLGPRELVLRDFRVYTGTGVTVPSPGTTCVTGSLKDDGLQPAIAQGFEQKYPG